MDIDHAAGAVSGNDHEAVMLARAVFLIRVLVNGSTKSRRLVTVPGQIRPLLRPVFVDPLEPVVDRDDRPV
jgi:hypothetical protein